MPRFRALTGAFGILLMLALGAPAFAHDQLIATVPQDGAALTDGPTEVTLTFSDDVLTVGTEVIVADGDGRHWVAGTPRPTAPTSPSRSPRPFPRAGMRCGGGSSPAMATRFRVG